MNNLHHFMRSINAHHDADRTFFLHMEGVAMERIKWGLIAFSIIVSSAAVAAVFTVTK
jgi:hypothetical protein